MWLVALPTGAGFDLVVSWDPDQAALPEVWAAQPGRLTLAFLRVARGLWRDKGHPAQLVRDVAYVTRRVLGTEERAAGRVRARDLARSREKHDRAARAQLDHFLRSGQRLVVPSSCEPEVSVVLVTYGRAELTLACLRSLCTVTVPVQVVIIDNASPDSTSALLDRLDGAIVVRNESNEGFLRAAQSGAGHATGRTLLLANSDIEIPPGSVEAALRAMEESRAGAVGGRLVLPDGSLQEAGAVVWPDGSTWGIGRGDRPDAAQYLFRRPVDYCSAAFLLILRRAWDDVGGFDDRYAPAYYEDVDLCLRLWEAGWSVVYEPDAVVKHYEFGSSTGERAAALMLENRARFVPRHHRYLGRLPTPAREPHPHLRRCGSWRVLVIEDRVPHPDLGSGFPRSLRLIEAMVELGWFVTLYPRHPADDAAGAYRTLPKVVEVMLGWDIAYLPRFLAERRGCYDVVVVCRSHNLSDVRSVLADQPDLIDGARLVYDAEAVTAVRQINAAAVAGEPLGPSRDLAMINAELSLAESADFIVAVSEREAGFFREALPETPVLVLSHAVSARPTGTAFAERRDLLFVGPLLAADTPNTDSVVWFAREVMPLLEATMGRAAPRLIVVGRVGELALSGPLPGVEFVGPVDDLLPFYASARLLVAPTRFAAGVPIKVLEAAAHGLPVVATELLAGQLGWSHGRELAVAPSSDAAAFAQACTELYLDEPRWNAVRAAALRRVEDECDVGRFRQSVEGLLGAASPEITGPSASVRPGT